MLKLTTYVGSLGGAGIKVNHLIGKSLTLARCSNVSVQPHCTCLVLCFVPHTELRCDTYLQAELALFWTLVRCGLQFMYYNRAEDIGIRYNKRKKE